MTRLILLLTVVFSRWRPCVAGDTGVPCADYEYVSATWHPPLEPECHSCYDCTTGQTCRRRGGCFNCSAGEYDSDGVPTHACEKCPDNAVCEGVGRGWGKVGVRGEGW